MTTNDGELPSLGAQIGQLGHLALEHRSRALDAKQRLEVLEKEFRALNKDAMSDFTSYSQDVKASERLELQRLETESSVRAQDIERDYAQTCAELTRRLEEQQSIARGDVQQLHNLEKSWHMLLAEVGDAVSL
jgi:hypothetical protein